MSEKSQHDPIPAELDHSAFYYLTSDELARYAQADADILEAEQAMAAMVEAALERARLSGYHDAPNPAEEAILAQFSDERERAALRVFYPKEIRQYAELKERCGNASHLLAHFFKVILTKMNETSNGMRTES